MKHWRIFQTSVQETTDSTTPSRKLPCLRIWRIALGDKCSKLPTTNEGEVHHQVSVGQRSVTWKLEGKGSAFTILWPGRKRIVISTPKSILHGNKYRMVSIPADLKRGAKLRLQPCRNMHAKAGDTRCAKRMAKESLDELLRPNQPIIYDTPDLLLA